MASARNHKRRSHRSYRKHLAAVFSMKQFAPRSTLHFLFEPYGAN